MKKKISDQYQINELQEKLQKKNILKDNNCLDLSEYENENNKMQDIM